MKTILLLITLVLIFPFTIHAAGFNLKSVGGIETGGTQGGKWWHTSGQPTLVGEGSPGTTIDITIDGTLYHADVNSDADWTFTPNPVLADGEHTVLLANQGSSFSFTLVTGKDNVDWTAVEKGTSQTLPTVGITWPTLALILIGLFGISMAGKTLLRSLG